MFFLMKGLCSMSVSAAAVPAKARRVTRIIASVALMERVVGQRPSGALFICIYLAYCRHGRECGVELPVNVLNIRDSICRCAVSNHRNIPEHRTL